MLEQAINAIAELAVEANKPTVINPGGDPRSVLLVKKDGTIEEFDVPPPLRSEKLASLSELAEFVKKQMTNAAIVFAAMDGVTALYDVKDRRERASLALAASDQWKLLSGAAGKSYGQREFYALLRVGFDGCLPDDRLLALVKSIKWQTSDSGASAVSNASHTMGRQLVAEVTGIDAVPDEVTLSVPVWDGLTLREPVRCAIDVNPDTRTFQISPFAGQISQAQTAALVWLKEDLVSALPSSVPVYLGKP